MYDKPRSGRPRSLTPEDEEFVKERVQQEPRSVKKIIAVLEDQRSKRVSQSSIKRTLKKTKLAWKRVRKSLKSKRDEEKFRKTQKKILHLEQRRQQGEIDLFYFDEAGFSLDPYIPYAWQPIGEYIEVPAAKRSGLNVLGFMYKDNDLTPFIVKGKIDTEVVVACFDQFSKNHQNKAVVIIDNTSVHKSKKFLANIAKWCRKGLILKFLPTYSPEFNLIEILWRKIKYE